MRPFQGVMSHDTRLGGELPLSEEEPSLKCLSWRGLRRAEMVQVMLDPCSQHAWPFPHLPSQVELVPVQRHLWVCPPGMDVQKVLLSAGMLALALANELCSLHSPPPLWRGVGLSPSC